MTAALSGLIRGTVLSASVLSITLGIVLAELDLVTVDVGSEGLIELIELALILTLVSDGLLVDRELLGRHWGPAARALVFAMPITLVLLALGGKLLFPDLAWAEAFLLGAVLCATDPVVTSSVVTSKRVPSSIRHTLNLESGLNDGLALPFVLFFLVLASPTGDAGQEAIELVGEAAFGAVLGIALGVLGGWLHRVVPGGVTARYEGIYAVGLGLAAFGLADVTFGNGLIAAFVFGITLGISEREITERFADFSENVSAIFQVLTFFVFGALIVATGFDGHGDRARRLHPLRPADRPAGGGRAGARGDEDPAAAQGVHRLVRPQGGGVDAVRAARPRLGGRPLEPRLRRRLVRDPGLDRRPRPHRHGRRPLDRAADGGAGGRMSGAVDLERIEVGDTRPDEVAEAVAVASRAMCTSPLTYAVIGDDPGRRYRHTHRWFTRLYRLAAHQRPLVARLDGRIVASSNDLVRGGCRPRTIDIVRSLPALAITGPRAAVRAARWFNDWGRRDPDRPHHHFGPFGVEPELQGRGIGTVLLREYTRRLDEAGEHSYLETEKPQNVALYGRFGYEVIDEDEVLGVPNWFMWREAGADAPATRDRR